jgi:protein TIF31
MRYLGKIAKLTEETFTFIPNVKSLNYLKLICEEEMVARACKHILRKLMASLPIISVSACISHFLNCLFSDGIKEITNDMADLSLKVIKDFLSLGGWFRTIEFKKFKVANYCRGPKKI